jgi:dihydroorotase (multifunctional complex type)
MSNTPTSRASLLLRDAVIYGRSGRVDGWISIRDGRIDDIGTSFPPSADMELDCGGRWVMPGLVDVHVHFRDPGATEKEDFGSGSEAAAAGGVTTVIDMPNTGNLVVSPQDVRTKLAAIEGRSAVDYGLHALLADSAPFAHELADMGVAGLKWMMGYEEIDGRRARPSSRRALRDALRASADAGLLVGVHAEDAGWIAELSDELREAGSTGPAAHGLSRPPFVEALAVAEAAILASEAGARMHVHHLSSALGLRVLDALRIATGCRFTAETSPHHLILTENDLGRLGIAAKVNPPLRASDDAAALWDGLAEGRIECIASDHAPHTPEQKSTPSIWTALSGLIGVETSFAVLFTQVRLGRITVERFIDAVAAAPARLVGLGHRKGVLEPGFDADLLIVDPDAKVTIDPGSLHSRHRHSVFGGFESVGRIDSVFLRGQRIVQEGRLEGPPRGMHVPSRNGCQMTANGRTDRGHQ